MGEDTLRILGIIDHGIGISGFSLNILTRLIYYYVTSNLGWFWVGDRILLVGGSGLYDQLSEIWEDLEK